MSGYVYVMSNPAMPGLVKVGLTHKTPDARCRELSMSTSVPCKFLVEGYWLYLSDRKATRMERLAHRAIGQNRIKGSEFFKISPGMAFFRIGGAIGTPSYIFREHANDEHFRLINEVQLDALV